MSQQQVIHLFQSLVPKFQEEAITFMEFLMNKQKASKLPDAKGKIRKAGTLKGLINYMAPDFDAPLDDMKDYM